MPANPWIGVAAPKEVPSKKIQDIVRHLFSGEAILDKRGYPIYDHIKNWPDLWYGHWVDLLPLLESDGRPFLLPLVGQICELARALE
jgi:hypothetical protein